MTFKQWQKKLGNKKIPGMHGVYDSYDMEGRIVVREVYIKGKRVMTLSPIGPEKEIMESRRKRRAEK